MIPRRIRPVSAFLRQWGVRNAHCLVPVCTRTPQYAPIKRYEKPKWFLVRISATPPAGFPNSPEKPPKVDKKLLRRKANLGTVIQMLQLRVPLMLQELLPEQFISKDIVLRILPRKFPAMPPIRGYTLYSTTLKALQFGITSFYLNPSCMLHITNIRVEEPAGSMSSDELINLSLNDTIIERSGSQALSCHTTKVIVKWRTCLKGCPHLKNNPTASAKLGSFSFDSFDLARTGASVPAFSKIIRDHVGNPTPGDKPLERVVTGVFSFELSADNSEILVLTIDDCDVLESGETDLKGVGLAPQA